MACDRPVSAPSPSTSASAAASFSADAVTPASARQDSHSFANPEDVVVRHLDLDWNVRFDRRVLDGSVTLHIERIAKGADTLRLDTRDLSITAVELSDTGDDWTPTPFTLGTVDPILGAPLDVSLSETKVS